MPLRRTRPTTLATAACVGCLMLSQEASPAAASSSSSKYSCLNEDGDAVDYFAMMKHHSGGDYDYADVDQTSYKTSSNSLEDKDGAVYHTLKQLYDDHSSIAYAMYNDQSSDGASHESRAHSKGVVAFDGDQGFWLIHSMPKFPNTVSEGYTGGLPDYTYGQSFLCMTFAASKFETIAAQQKVNFPYVYDSNLPSSMEDDFPTFASWLDGDKSDDETSVVSLSTAGSRSFKHFAKSKAWGKDLYEDLVAPELGGDLYVATWQNGATSNVMETFCKGSSHDYNVYNIVNHTAADGDTWEHTSDHSKWAITTSESKHYTCIGDINRQYSQEDRGGGTMCYSLKSLWETMYDQFSEYEPCD